MKNKVVANASIVTGLSIAERALGFLYRIVLSRLIGAEGLGLYQVALSLFGLFLTIGTGGIPITVSRMISKSKAENDVNGERKVVGAGITACLLLTLPVAILLAIFGGKLTFLFSDMRSYGVFRILLIGLSLSAIYAVLRGFFWGNKEFLAPSIMEIAEESVMVIAGILLLRNVSSSEIGAEKAAWAVVISYIFSFTISVAWFFIKKGKIGNPKGTLKPLFTATLPITSVRASGALVTSAVAVLLPAMLVKAGASHAEALKTFGIVTGMVIPILFIPSTVIGSIALVLVPELSEDFYRKNHLRLRTNLARGLKFAVLVACVLIPFFFAVGADVGTIAYSNQTAGEMIQRSALLLLPMSVTMITTAMLNSMGFEKQTFLFYFIGAAVMLLCVLFLPALCGGYAYVVGLGASYLVNAVCNLVFLSKKCPFYEKRGRQVFVHEYLPLLLAMLPISLLGVLANRLFKYFAGEFVSLLLTVLLLAVVSVFVYAAVGAFELKKARFLFPFKKRSKRKKRAF